MLLLVAHYSEIDVLKPQASFTVFRSGAFYSLRLPTNTKDEFVSMYCNRTCSIVFMSHNPNEGCTVHTRPAGVGGFRSCCPACRRPAPERACHQLPELSISTMRCRRHAVGISDLSYGGARMVLRWCSFIKRNHHTKLRHLLPLSDVVSTYLRPRVQGAAPSHVVRGAACCSCHIYAALPSHRRT